MDSYAISLNQLHENKTILNQEKNQKKRKLEDFTTLKDVGFFPYDLDTPTKSFSGYINIFENIGKDRSKYILYPYGFKYKKQNKDGILEENEQSKGGFFSLDSKLVPGGIKNIKNITTVEISKSKALYDLDIGIFSYETTHENIKKDLFIEADSFCSFFSQSLPKVKTCSLTIKDFEENKKRYSNKGNLLLISPEILKNDDFDLNSFGFLIIPDYILKTEDIILRAWEQKGIDKIISFVNQGGNVLATGKSGFLLEKLGLIEEGSYITDKNLYYKENYGLVDIIGCEDIISKTPLEQNDFYKQTMCMNYLNKIYLTSIFTMKKALIEEKKELNVIINLSPEYINDKLIFNLDNGDDEGVGENDYFPIILTKQEDKKGRITIINGNLFVNTENTFHLIINPLLYSMGKNIIFDAYIKYESNTQEDMPIPGGEQGIILNCYFKFINLFEKGVSDVTVDIFIAIKTEFYDIPSGCVKVTNDKTKYINFTDMEMSTYLQCSIDTLDKFSEFSKSITIEVTDQSVTQKSTAIPIFYPLLSYKDSDSIEGEKKFIDYGPVTVTASLSAILRVTANSEPPGDYPLYAWGLFMDQVFQVENKENTEAKNVNLISVIPLVSAIINDIKNTSVVHTVELYDEYYKKHDYSYPWTKTAEEYDYIDYAELSGKDVIIDKDFEQPVKYFKVERIDIKDESKNIMKLEENIDLDIEENSLVKTNSQLLLKQVCFQDADIFYEVADFRRLPFIDTSKSKGAQTYYNNNIPSEEQDPEDNSRAKIEVPFSRVDFYFMKDPNYQTPDNINDDMIITIDKYPEPTIKTDEEIKKYKANINLKGNFDSTKHDGKLIADEYYNVLKQHNQIKKYINPLKEGYNITKDFPDIKLSHYLIAIPGDRIKRAGSIKDFIEEDNKFGYLKEYPHVKFIYAHTINFILGKKLTRLGGKLVIDLGANEFKDNKIPSEHEFVTMSVDGVAVHKIDYEYIKGEKNIITAYFRRGLMPDEIAGKDSNVQLNIENLTLTSDLTINMELYELKYDLSKPETHFESYKKVNEFETERTLIYNKFWSLPCLIIENKFVRKPSDTIKEYELLEPYSRFTLYFQELLKHRTIFCNSLSNHVSNPGIQTPYSNYGLISNIGIVSIPFSDYVVHPTLIIPAATSTSRIEWEDIWGRKWAQPIRSITPDFLPLPYVSQNFMMSTTYEIIQNGTRELEWNSRDEADVLIHIKFLNNYFKYVNLAICKNNQNLEGDKENQFINITHSNVYGKCYQNERSVLSGQTITSQISDKMDKAMLCGESDNTLEMVQCAQKIKNLNLPLLEIKDPQFSDDKIWNYSPLVESYYPKGYLNEKIMWDMTKLNYASDVYFKGYPWHYDNTLPGIDKLYYDKADNLMAFPIFKGFGYKMEYDKDNKVENRYNNMKGWWSDNLQNRDQTLLAGQDHSNIYPTINETLLTEDSWTNAKQINSTIAEKKLKNIYVCQFNQHRIKVKPETNTQLITFSNIFQNNIIPMYPELDDSQYKEYDCTDVYQYSPQNISLVDNRVKTNTDRDWLYFSINLRAEAKETLNIILKLKPFEDRQFEGSTKVNDGGRFTYWNPALTRNGYIYLDNNVNIVESYRTDIQCDVKVFPYVVNTFKAVNYHLFTLEDKNEKLREYTSKTYTNSYGFGDAVTLVYVGGTKDSDCRIKPGEETYVKITLYNNAGFDWNMKVGAITEENSKIKFWSNNDLMKDKVHSIQVPKEYNFLELIIPEPLKNYIEIKPSDHNKDLLPQFFDFQCINVVTIRDGYIGEYYYKMTLKPGLDEKYFGRLWEIKVNLKSEYFDILPGFDNDPYLKVNQDKVTLRHDYQLKIPSIKFGIPYPSDYKIPEYRNKVFYTIGRAHDLKISYNHLKEFNLDDIKIVSDDEVEKLQKASTNEQNYNEELLDIWNNGIANKSSLLNGDITIEQLEPSGENRRVWIFLNKVFPEFPYEKYGEPDVNKINLLIKLSADQTSDGKKLGIRWGYGTFNDTKTIRKTNVDNAAYISVKGPWILVDVEKTILNYNKDLSNFTTAENQANYPSGGYMKLKITAKNSGSNIAYQASYKYVFSSYVEILNFGDVNKKKDIISLKRGNNGETIIDIKANKQMPISTKDAYNIYVKYDFNDELLRNLEDNTDKEKVIIKTGSISLCQNAICNNDESLVNQNIDINFKMSLKNIASIEHPESIPELEINLEENNKEPESKSKAWIAAIVVCFVIILLCIYLLIDYKKKIFIFKKRNDYINTEAKLENNNEKIDNNNDIEKISVKKKRRRISNLASADNIQISN